MEGRNRQTRIQNCKTQEGEVSTFKYSCIFHLWLTQEFSENPAQLPKMLTHLVIVFIAPCFQRPSSLSSDLACFREYSSLCGLRAKIYKGVRQDTGQKCRKDPFFGHPSTSTHGDPHIHPYIDDHYGATLESFGGSFRESTLNIWSC